jgi:hypothetical protein
MTEKDSPQAKQTDPTPVEVFIAEWRSLICPQCQQPLDMQQRDPVLWLCAMCRKWFNEKLEGGIRGTALFVIFLLAVPTRKADNKI